ncbi:MAG: hypothetical protein KKD44_22695 [Proteobacteria bacterium]|nr:hypothetical protein [Pseudomonadota bacterium]
MKKKIRSLVLGVCMIALAFLLFTPKETGKKEPPGLGYQDEDVFETGRMAGEFELGPVNDDFIDFDGSSQDAKALYKKKGSQGNRGLGLIPSPVPMEVYQAKDAKSLKGTLYDEVYDLRDPDNDGNRSDSLLPPAREQWDCGACWAFASYGGIEGTVQSRLGYSADFSENHAIFSSGYDWGGCGGGNVDMSMAYLSRNGGPIFEKDDPFYKNPIYYCRDCPPVRYIDSVVKLKVRSRVSDVDYIKKALMDYGPLYASMNWSDGAFHPDDFSYYSDTFGANHAVTLVGWDDHKIIRDALSKGAFIARNSWGSDWGQDGYFYVSYDDRSLAFSSLVAFTDDPDSLLSFDRMYYHDDLGMTSSTGYGKAWAWGASAFTPDKDGTLVAVSVYTTAFNTSYEVSVYDSMAGGRLNGKLIGPFYGNVTGKGYHTLRLDHSLTVDRGDDFIVAVKFETPESSWPVPLEKPFPDYSSAAHADPGESFLSSDGIVWKDTISVFPDTSVCIKALVREKDCVDDFLQVSGAGNEGDFLIRNKEGPLVMAVVTNDCGDPVMDAEVSATFSTGDPDIELFDDGQHDDQSMDDGIYANRFDSGSQPGLSTVLVKAMKDDRETYKAGEDKQDEPGKGSDGGGCFITELFI